MLDFSKKQIHSFMWCKTCAEQSRSNQFEIGLTNEGIQIWCKRHNCNVVHLTPDELQEELTKGCMCDECKKAGEK